MFYNYTFSYYLYLSHKLHYDKEASLKLFNQLSLYKYINKSKSVQVIITINKIKSSKYKKLHILIDVKYSFMLTEKSIRLYK